MVARIALLKRLLDALNYNEKKVEKGTADCIHAGNYLRTTKEMNFYQKFTPLKNLEDLNTRAKTKTLHVSLNFDPSENLSDNMLIKIACSYMDQLGFGDQPFLVYRHEDAGHPHIHVVSTAIRSDGSRINTHNIGKVQSEKARKDIEVAFNLIKASSKKAITVPIKPIDLHIAQYGKTETKKTISNIVNHVFNNYVYSSLPEFNAALRQFNVLADRGKEGSRIQKHQGLLFRIIDETGNKLGVPIKASIISCKPTLQNLQKKFKQNTLQKDFLKTATKERIDHCISKHPVSITQLSEFLKQNNIYTLQRLSSDGRAYGITFVDNTNKCVFNGSDIGRGYSIAGLHAELNKETKAEGSPQNFLHQIVTCDQKQTPIEAKILNDLISPVQEFENIPQQLKMKKKKKRKSDNN